MGCRPVIWSSLLMTWNASLASIAQEVEASGTLSHSRSKSQRPRKLTTSTSSSDQIERIWQLTEWIRRHKLPYLPSRTLPPTTKTICSKGRRGMQTYLRRHQYSSTIIWSAALWALPQCAHPMTQRRRSVRPRSRWSISSTCSNRNSNRCSSIIWCQCRCKWWTNAKLWTSRYNHITLQSTCLRSIWLRWTEQEVLMISSLWTRLLRLPTIRARVGLGPNGRPLSASQKTNSLSLGSIHLPQWPQASTCHRNKHREADEVVIEVALAGELVMIEVVANSQARSNADLAIGKLKGVSSYSALT